MTDHPTTHLDAERTGATYSPDDLPHDRAALDRAMREAGITERELRHRESNLREVICRLYLQFRLKCGHSDTRAPSVEVFHEAMACHGFTPVWRHNARAVGRRLGQCQRDLEELREDRERLQCEVAMLRAQVPPAGDEPTEERPAPDPVIEAPPGLRVTRLHPSCPAAQTLGDREGVRWWTVRHDASGEVLTRCASSEALTKTLAQLAVLDWTAPISEGHREAVATLRRRLPVVVGRAA